MDTVTEDDVAAIKRYPPIWRWEVNALIEYCDQFGDRHQSDQPFFYDSGVDAWEPDAPMTQTWEIKGDPACNENEEK